VLLMKPTTYMNNSGQAVVEAMNFYKLPPENVIVIFDDVSLDVGKMRIRMQGSDGGQKGMRSIIYLSGKDTFPRIKIGIGAKPNPQWDLADWVLSQFTSAERKTMNEQFEKAAAAAELIIKGDAARAMNLYN
jgi:PTH1 family peptidyl-tRNA hydrolase